MPRIKELRPEKERIKPGSVVQLYPEPVSEGPHPDDQFMPPGAICTILSVDRHPNNPLFLWGAVVQDAETGEEITLVRYPSGLRYPAVRPLGAIWRVLAL
jgi:hypothetical protein